MNAKPIKILLIEDNPGDARLLREMLTEIDGVPFDLEWSDRLSAGLERLGEKNIDAVLLDLTLPDSKGLDTFTRLQKETAGKVPITVLSGMDDADLAIQAVREGAQDYLVKGEIGSSLLARAIRYAIERKRGEEEVRRRAAHLEALNAVIAAATAAPDVPQLLETALRYTLQALNLSRGAIWWAGHYFTRGLEREGDQASPEEILSAGLSMATPIAIQDWKDLTPQDPLAALQPAMLEADIRASLVTPILVEERRIGGLALVSRAPRPWLQEETALLDAIGKQLGAAAERLRLFQAERTQRELAEALQEAAAVVSSSLEAEEVLDHILEQVERVVMGDAFNIMLLSDNGSARVARRRGYKGSQDAEDRIYEFSELPNLPQMVSSGEPIVVPDTSTDPDWVPLEGRQWLRSYVGAPIRIGDLTVGFLNVNGTKIGQFDSSDALRLQAFASHAATAIQNAQLYRELQHHAEQLEERVQQRTAQLQTQYAQLQAILRSSSDGIIVVDGDGSIIQSNPVAQAWLTRTLSPEDAVTLEANIRDLAQHVEDRPETVLELTGLDLQLSAAPIVDPGMEAAAVVIDVHDISHLKALDRMKSRFVSNVSHELRTPITTIKLYAALMQRSSPEKWREYLDVLIKEADRQARLVEDILQISRIDSGRLEMKPCPTQLNDLTDTVCASHQVLAEEKDLTLTFDSDSSDPTVLVDPDRLTQVLTNLITNAIQYTPVGGRVEVSTGTTEADSRLWATVVVVDNGMGIPKDELPHIFDRFFRGEQPRAMQVSGTGLGLAITKEIIELQGGQVTVSSEMNAGTMFKLWLPLAK